MIVSSLQNKQVKNVVKLRDRRQRDRQGLMIIEGYRELNRFLESPHKLQTLFYCQEWFQGTNEPKLMNLARQRGAELIEVTRPVFKKMAYRDRPEGLLAIAPIPSVDFKAFEDWYSDFSKADKKLFLLVVEAIEKPGNLGTILRSSDAAGADAVFVCDQVTDLFNPNVIRASLGTLFCMPVFRGSSEQLLEFLNNHNIPSFAATPFAEDSFTKVDMTRPCAPVIGSEQYGLSDLWMKKATKQIRIPMAGRADSLNAAQAATLVMFEVVRQNSD